MQKIAQQKLYNEREARREKVADVLRDSRLTRHKALWSAPVIYTNFVWLMAYRDIWEMLLPYRTREFARRWKPLVTKSYEGYATDITHVITEVRDELIPQRYHEVFYHRFLSHATVDDLLSFLTEYREGAFLTLALIDAARLGSWKKQRTYMPSSSPELYPNLCLFDLPTVSEEDGLSTLRLLLALNERMREKHKNEDEFLHTFLAYFRVDPFYYERIEEETPYRLFKPDPRWSFRKERYLSALSEARFPPFDPAPFTFDSESKREDVRTLKTALTPGRSALSGIHSWAILCSLFYDTLTRDYLIARACDLVRFGEQIANLTFPEPVFPDARELTTHLVWLLQDTEKRAWEERTRNAAAAALPGIERDCAEKLAGLTVNTPEQFAVRVPTDAERKALIQECLEALFEGESDAWNPRETLQLIEDFARFCYLLSLPENHIKMQSGQYTERAVPSRTVRDMIDEMAQELTSLPRYHAYAKVTEERDGKQHVLKRQITTLPPLPTDNALRLRIEQEARDRTRRFHCRERTIIAEEIRQEELAWQQAETARAAKRATRSGHRPEPSQSAKPEDTPPGRD